VDRRHAATPGVVSAQYLEQQNEDVEGEETFAPWWRKIRHRRQEKRSIAIGNVTDCHHHQRIDLTIGNDLTSLGNL
jgi:hypothetical protein